MNPFDLLAQTPPDHNIQVVLWTLVGTHVLAALGMIVKAFTDYFTRVNDRRDRELQHKIALEAGERRKAEITKEVAEVKSAAKEAFTTANGHNEKIAKAVGAMAEATKAFADDKPRAVVVVNPPDQPVVTKSTLNPEGADEQ